jgi:serine/threonine-protein kinase
MKIAAELKGKPFQHIIPIHDAGRDSQSGRYYIVMAKADRSLQDAIASTGCFDPNSAASILLQISQGLSEVPAIVHRDLKPSNILFHEGKWKVADYGVARFVEEATSMRTLRACLSPDFAAPEQWRGERATVATDLYALGIIAYYLLAGNVPFSGPDYGDQHCHEHPMYLSESIDSRLRALVAYLLLKSPEARPPVRRVLSTLEDVVRLPHLGATAAFNDLANVGAAILERESMNDAVQKTADRDQVMRYQLCCTAHDVLREDIVKPLADRITSTTPAARVALKTEGSDGEMQLSTLDVTLGRGRLHIRPFAAVIQTSSFMASGWDVVAMAEVAVRHVVSLVPVETWSASMWYAKLPGTEEYRWHEVSYAQRQQDRMAPHPMPCSLCDDLQSADVAAANPNRPVLELFDTPLYSIAFGPVAIDYNEIGAFHARWVHLLARATRAPLLRPGRLPLGSDGW